MKLVNSLLLGWKLLRIIFYIILAITFSSIFFHKGKANSNVASGLFIWWNQHICNIFKAHITVHGSINDEATLYVMNHISWFDIPALASQKFLHFLSKAEVKSWPLIGGFTERAGTLFIQRGAAGSAQNSLNEISQCLKAGGSVVVFPEGTTSDGASLKNFHGSLLQAAIDAQVKIQPIALRYPYEDSINLYVPYIGDLTFIDSVMGLTKSKPLKVELSFLEPLTQHLMPNENISNKQLAKAARQAIANKLDIKL